jgi:CheY-like chemotaxis protein
MPAVASSMNVVPRTALAVFPTDTARDFACDVLRAAGVISVLPAGEPRGAHPCVDVIVTDWPPGNDIGAHIDALRQSNIDHRDTPIVLLTAREGRADLDAARRAGVAAYVVKPVSPAMLKSRLSKIVATNAPGR